MIGNKLTPFKFWCQKVLPTVYDDSLSYYEYLTKLNEYLNEVIEQINTLTQAEEDFQEDLSAQWETYKTTLTGEWTTYKTGLTAEWNAYKDNLTAQWTTTKNYIDNYFDNLDVQDEINAKLDVMVTDGTMTTLLTPIVGGDISDLVTAWLNENVDPVGSAVVVDSSLTVSGAAADAKVTGDEIRVINKSAVILTTSDVVDNVGILESGKEYANNNYISTDFISIDKCMYGKEIYVNSTLAGLFGIAFYDNDKFLVDSIIGNTATTRGYVTGTSMRYFVIPSGAKYFRVTLNKSESSYSTPNDFNLHYFGIENMSSIMDMGWKGINVDEFEKPLKDSFTPKFEAIDIDFDNENHYARYDTGVVISYNTIDCSDYIDCSGIRKIRLSGKNFYSCAVICFYDENQNFVGAYPNTTEAVTYTNEVVDVPAVAKYFIANNYMNNTRVEKITSYGVLTDVKKWSDKKWVCVGDSLTSVNATSSIRYLDYISDVTGIETVNMGDSGTGYAKESENNRAFYQRINNVPSADVVTIFGSFNDLASSLPLGTADDSGVTTIGGCMNQTFDNLFAIRPTIQLGVIAPTPWVGTNANPTTQPNAGSQYVELLREICSKRGIPFLDLFHCSGLRPWDSAYRELVYDKDPSNGIHPNEIGHKIIATHIEAFLDTLLLH